MGEVDAVHDVADTDHVAERPFGPAEQRSAEVALTLPVLARGEREMAEAVLGVEGRKVFGHPSVRRLGDDDLEIGVTLEHTTTDQELEGPGGPERCFRPH